MCRSPREPDDDTSDPLIQAARGIRSDLNVVRNLLRVLIAITAVGAFVGAVMAVATVTNRLVLNDVNRGVNAAEDAAAEAKATGDRLVDCTTPSVRDPATGAITKRHECWETLRAPNNTPGQAPAMVNVDCLVRRAIQGLEPPADLNNCPAG